MLKHNDLNKYAANQKIRLAQNNLLFSLYHVFISLADNMRKQPCAKCCRICCFVFTTDLSISVVLNYGLTQNQPESPRTNQNHPEPARTSQNQLEPARLSLVLCLTRLELLSTITEAFSSSRIYLVSKEHSRV